LASIAQQYKGNEMLSAARESPAPGYALEVDGRLKAEFATREGARAGGEELKRRFPVLQIKRGLLLASRTHSSESGSENSSWTPLKIPTSALIRVGAS
jgi:hypothetical protein